MSRDPRLELAAILARVRRRWRMMRTLRIWTGSALMAGAVLALAWLAAHLVAAGPALVALWAAALLLASATVVRWAVRSWPAPGDGQVARFVEERCPELEDSLATAVAELARESMHPFAEVVIGDAHDRVRESDLARVVTRSEMRQAVFRAAAASAVLAVTVVMALAPAIQAGTLLLAYLFPSRIELEVAPGDVRVEAGRPLEITARLGSAGVSITPTLRLRDEDASVETPMEVSAAGFSHRFARVERSFTYSVAAVGASSREFTVTVIRPPQVERIDLRYDFPSAFHMQSRLETDGGDIYGPAGTRVRLLVYTDKPVTQGHLALGGGRTVALSGSGEALEGEVTIEADGSYRVALTDVDGLVNPGETEYFIRTIDDRPPEVRIVRPAADRQVTPLEEVTIEARADDDFGVASFELVYAVRGEDEKAVPLERSGAGMTVNGRATLYLEEMGVEPGDFVTYYARARDISRGKRSSEARSDIYFLQVSPFDEEFVLSESQAGGQSGDSSVDDLVEAQKNLITATWKIDRRSSDAGRSSAEDVRTLARGEADIRRRALAAAAQMQRNADVRRRRPGVRPPGGLPPADPSENAMSRAAEAMRSAQEQLETLRTSPALPFEMQALNELLRAQADVRRREVQRQQASGGSGRAANRQQQDLSSLFDRELARQQQSNYEAARASSETKSAGSEDDTLDRIRELARRQEALNNDQQALARSRRPDDERKRELERLTREQSDLRQQAEELARRLQQGQQQAARPQDGRAGDQGSSQAADRSRAMSGVSEQMRAAASDLRRDDPARARERGARALDELRRLERQVGDASSTGLDRALGELQLESRQVAEAQRRVSSGESGRGGPPEASPARSAEQSRLADRMRNLEDAVRDLARGSGGSPQSQAQRVVSEASRELERQRLSQRMRANAANRNDDDAAREGNAIAEQLDRLSARLGGARDGETDETRRLGDALARIRELRDELAALDRQLSEQGQTPEPSSRPAEEGARGNESGSEPGMEAARRLLDQLRRDGTLGLTPDEIGQLSPGQSAPGTEAWKQDFSRWEQLRQQAAAALERAESRAAERLRAQRARDRLSAGAAQSVPEQYRRLVENYYRALAARTREAQGR